MLAPGPDPRATLALAIADPQLREQAGHALRNAPVRLLGDLPQFHNAEELAAEVSRTRPEILMLGLPGLPLAFGDALQTLRSLPGAPRVIALNSSADSTTILQAMRAGVTEYLYPPFGPEFAEALTRIEAECEKERAASRPEGQVIACISSKGGCGATTLACHAALCYRRAGKETLLADLDFSAGVAAMCLQADPRYTMTDVLGNLQRIDLTLWKALVAQGPDGIDLIAAPVDPLEFGPYEQALRSLARFWRAQYDWTVVDLGRGVTPMLTALAPEFDQIALVITEEPTALRVARQTLRALNAARVLDRVRLVLNRAPKRPAFPAAELERLLEAPLFGSIALDTDSGPQNAADSKPLQIDTGMGAAMAQVMARMAGLPVDSGKRKLGWFGKGR